MRSLLIAAVLVLLGSPAFAENPPCYTQEDIMNFFINKFPDAKRSVFKGDEANAIKARLAKSGAEIVGDRVFMVITIPNIENLLLIGFRDGCYEAQKEISRKELDEWLAGKGVQK